MSDSQDVLYIIEDDPMLSAVKDYIEDRSAVFERSRQLAGQYGAERASRDRRDGRLIGVTFPHGQHHAEFTKPKGRHGLCFPKKGTHAAKVFDEQIGHVNAETLIATTFKVPLWLKYSRDDGSHGGCCIGRMLAACGFLYFGANGPYALWIPDVPAHIKNKVDQGYKVEPFSFDMTLPGCRRILPEEWDLMVAQHKLSVARTQNPEAA